MPPKREIVHDINLQKDAPLSALENVEIKKQV